MVQKKRKEIRGVNWTAGEITRTTTPGTTTINNKKNNKMTSKTRRH